MMMMMRGDYSSYNMVDSLEVVDVEVVEVVVMIRRISIMIL